MLYIKFLGQYVLQQRYMLEKVKMDEIFINERPEVKEIFLKYEGKIFYLYKSLIKYIIGKRINFIQSSWTFEVGVFTYNADYFVLFFRSDY